MPKLAQKVLDQVVADVAAKDGELAGDLTAQLLEPLREHIAFIDQAPAEIGEFGEQLVRQCATLCLHDQRMLDEEDHPFQDALRAIEAFVNEPPGEEKELASWRSRLNRVITRLKDADHNDPQAFGKIESDLDSFRKRMGRREALAKKRATQAAEAKARLQQNRESVANVIVNLLKRMRPLPEIAELIGGPWENAVVLEALRSGIESGPTARMIKSAQDLIKWSRSDREMSEKLQARLIEGLATVGFSTHEAEQTLAELPVEAAEVKAPEVKAEAAAKPTSETRPAARSVPRKSAAAEPAAQPVESDASTVIPAPTNKTSLPPAEKPQSAPPRPKPEPKVAPERPNRVANEQKNPPRKAKQAQMPAPEPADARAASPAKSSAPSPSRSTPMSMRGGTGLMLGGVEISKGDWFEFRGQAGERVRAKLSWISPVSRNLLFVDERGIKVADMPFEGLRADVASREARLIRSNH